MDDEDVVLDVEWRALLGEEGAEWVKSWVRRDDRTFAYNFTRWVVQLSAHHEHPLYWFLFPNNRPNVRRLINVYHHPTRCIS